MKKLTLMARVGVWMQLVSLFYVPQLQAQSVACPTISNTRITAVTVCSGKTVDSLQVATTAPATNTIEFVQFDTIQPNPYQGKGGVHLGEVSIVNGLATQRDLGFQTNKGPAARTYYVYACLKPEPTDPSCAPFALITVTIAACDCPPPKCIPITIRRLKRATTGQ